MKIGKIKITSYLTLFTFITGWIIGNFTFPAVSLAMSSDHSFKFTSENKITQVVFYHPEIEEDFIVDGYDKNIVQIAQLKSKSHEHKFNIPDVEDDLILINNPSFKIDSERGPPLLLISETFNFLPEDIDYYFKDYKYPSGRSTSSFSLKTVILLN